METIGYYVETTDFNRLRQINERLFTDRPLSPDERRDLANTMRVLLDRAQSLTADDLK